MCGEQLVDIISSHNLRPAHLNSIYTRLAQLGADVAPGPVPSGSMGGQYNDQSPPHSGRQQQNSVGGHRQAGGAYGGEEHDTATSGGAVCDDGGYGDQADVQSVRSDASPQRAPARQQQVQHAVAAENSSRSMLDGGSSKSWGPAAAGKAKRGGYKVRGILLPYRRLSQQACGSGVLTCTAAKTGHVRPGIDCLQCLCLLTAGGARCRVSFLVGCTHFPINLTVVAGCALFLMLHPGRWRHHQRWRAPFCAATFCWLRARAAC